MFERWFVPFISILFIVDPLAVIPSYLAMTETDPPDRRRNIAFKAAVATAAILGLFAFAGGLIFKVFGLTLPAFRIAGGVILGLSAIEMIRAERPSSANRGEGRGGAEKTCVALATPAPSLPVRSAATSAA